MRQMRVGLLYDFANPPQWKRDPAELHATELAQIVRAETLGIDGVWVAEHHFSDTCVSSPFVILGAIAALTKRIRIGSCVAITPIHNPLRLAEDLATLDILSQGRVELGAGLGWSREEYDAFGIDPSSRVGIMREILEIVRLAWEQDVFSYHGQHFTYDNISVHPRPIQKPRPPVLVGASSLEGARRVGRWGYPMMWVDPDLNAAYLDAWTAAGLAPEDAAVDGYLNLFVCDDPDTTWHECLDYFHFQNSRNTGPLRPHAGPKGTVVYAETPSVAEMHRRRERGELMILTPQQAVAEITRLTKGLPVKGIICNNRMPGMPDAVSDRHVHLLATEVGPALVRLNG